MVFCEKAFVWKIWQIQPGSNYAGVSFLDHATGVFLFFSYFTNFFRIAFDIESLWMALPLCVHQQRSGTAASDQGLSGVRETPHVWFHPWVKFVSISSEISLSCSAKVNFCPYPYFTQVQCVTLKFSLIPCCMISLILYSKVLISV